MSMVICVCIAFIYLRYKSPVYQVSVKMLIKDDNNGNYRGGQNQMMANMQDFGFISSSTGIDNEVEILKSHILATEAVKDLKLYTEYRAEGRIKKQLIYNTQPINVDIDAEGLKNLEETRKSIALKIEVSGKKYIIKGGSKEKPISATLDKLPATLDTEYGKLTFTKNVIKTNAPKEADEEEDLQTATYIVTIMPPSSVGSRYVAATSVAPTSKMTTIAQITVNDMNPKRGEDYLKQLAICYNNQANADKKEIAIKTEEFINGQIGRAHV